MKRSLTIALIVCAAHTSASADGTVFTLNLDGNDYVCADLNERNPGLSSPEGQWVVGYWSGLNVGRDADVGNTTSANGIFGEVKLHCRSNPSQRIVSAVSAVYLRMKAAKT